MIDFGQLLAEKTETIVEQWVAVVRQDRQLESVDELSPTAIRDHIPHVLQAMATVLSRSTENDIETLTQASLNHGVLRAVQGFDPKEIAHEYCLLREEIFSALQPDLLQSSPPEIVRAFRLIDRIVDEAIAQCFKSYVEERLRELDQLKSQLDLTNQELNRLIHTSQENLSHLAHELKTPLNSIIGYSELMLRQQRQKLDIRDNNFSIESIERVLRNGRGLLHLVNNVLELSRYEAGRMQLHLMPTKVRSLIYDVAEMIEPLASTSGLEIILDCDRAPEEVLVDPLRLQQVITNLLSNAIRYTPTGSVRLECQMLTAEEWSIAIADTGIGIAPQDQARIFEPYFRVASAHATTAIESTGLGLAIVYRLVKLLQGKIELASELGKGSTFTVILPLEVKVTHEAIASSSRPLT